MEGHAPYIECRACMNSRSSPAGLRVARWMRRFRSRYQALSPDVMVNAQADAQNSAKKLTSPGHFCVQHGIKATELLP